MSRPPILAYAEPELILSAIDDTSVHSNIDRLLLESKIQGYQRGGPAENGPKTYDTGTESEKYFEDVEIPDKYRKGILNLFNIAQNPVVEVHTPQTLFQTLRERQPLKFEGQTFDEEHAKYMPEGMFFSGAEESIPDTIRYMGSQHAPAIASEIGHGLLERYPELGNLFLSGEQPTQEIMDKILSGEAESGRTSNVQEAINREKKLETDRMESYKDLQSVEGFTHEGIEPFIYDYLRKSASGYQDGGPAESSPNLYEWLSGGLSAKEHREQSKKEAQAEREDTELLESRREAILPYLEFATGVPAMGERDEKPTLTDLALTAPVIGGVGLGAFKAGKEIYSRATTTPVWRGITQKLKTTPSLRTGKYSGDWVKGSPLYKEALHTSMNPERALLYATKFGGGPESQLLKFRVPNKIFREAGTLGPFQKEAEEVIFESGLPKKFMEYAKKPSELSLLDKLENYIYSRGRGGAKKTFLKTHEKAKKLREKGMKSIAEEDTPRFYTPESNLRFDKSYSKYLDPNAPKDNPMKGFDLTGAIKESDKPFTVTMQRGGPAEKTLKDLYKGSMPLTLEMFPEKDWVDEHGTQWTSNIKTRLEGSDKEGWYLFPTMMGGLDLPTSKKGEPPLGALLAAKKGKNFGVYKTKKEADKVDKLIHEHFAKLGGWQRGGPAERPPLLGYMNPAVQDETAHSQMDRLILEDKMNRDPLSGLVQKPQHSISVPREYHPEDALPIGGMLRGGKGALAMLKHSYGPYAKQAAHYRNILDKKLMKILKKYESQTRGRSIEKSLSTGAGQEATQEAMETDFIIQKLKGKI